MRFKLSRLRQALTRPQSAKLIDLLMGIGGVIVGVTVSLLVLRAQPPGLEERVSSAVRALKEVRVLVADLEEEVERLRNLNEELTQEQLTLESWIKVKEHEDTLRPYFESLTQRSARERRTLTAISIFGGWLVGVTTPQLSKRIRRFLRPTGHPN